MTVALLTERLGSERVEAFLVDDDAGAREVLPHAEVSAPIPDGIQPYFDAPPPTNLPPAQIALIGAFSMPVSDQA